MKKLLLLSILFGIMGFINAMENQNSENQSSNDQALTRWNTQLQSGKNYVLNNFVKPTNLMESWKAKDYITLGALVKNQRSFIKSQQVVGYLPPAEDALNKMQITTTVKYLQDETLELKELARSYRDWAGIWAGSNLIFWTLFHLGARSARDIEITSEQTFFARLLLSAGVGYSLYSICSNFALGKACHNLKNYYGDLYRKLDEKQSK